METNENIIEPQEEIVSSIDEGIGEVVGGSSEPVLGDNPFEDKEEPTQPVEPSQDVLSSLINLALTGYELPDILAAYGKVAGWDGEVVKSAVLTYGHDFGQFLMDEGLIDSEVEKKFLNYTMHYHIVDSLERLGKVDFCKKYDEFKEWIVTWAETKNYQSVLDALNTIGGKEVVSVSTVDGIASVDASKALLADGVVFEMGGKVTSVKAASIALNNSKIVSEVKGNKGNTITFNAAEDISLKNCSVEGEYPTKTTQLIITKNTSNAEPAVLTISGSTFAASGYNAINIGNANDDWNYKEINIIGCDFSSVLENNAINIYGCAEGAVINIKNCTFAGSLSNPIRFFNTSNVHATINIENCVFGQWELDQPDLFTGVNEEHGYDYQYAYAGMMLFEDHKSGSTEAEMENKKFAKVTLNIINCTGPFGKIVAPKNLADVCGCMNKNQLIYVCYYKTVPYVADNGKNVYSIGYAGYEDHFPTINIR